MTKSALFGVAFMVVAGAAGAVPVNVTFDLSTPYGSVDYGSNGSSFSLNEGGLSATFSANAFRRISIDNNIVTDSSVRVGEIGRWTTGAGAVTHRRDSHFVDGGGQPDFLQVNFSKSVSVSEVTFSYFREDSTRFKCTWYSGYRTCGDVEVDGDDFRWLYDLSGDGTIGTGDWISEDQSANPFREFGSVSSSVFAFGAFGWNDFWKLKSVSVTYDVPNNEPPAVPLPASGLLLLGALAGVAGMRRRKTAPEAY